MPKVDAKPWEKSSEVRSDRPRLTPRGVGLLAISSLAMIHGCSSTEAGFVHLGLLGLILLGGAFVWAGRNLQSLSCTRSTPASAFAGQYFPLTLTVMNGRSRLDAFAVEVEDSVAGPTEKGLRAGWLQAGGSSTRGFQTRLQKRGILHPARISFGSSFPLGLWESRIGMESEVEMTIFPRPVAPKLFEDPNLIALLESNEAESTMTDWDGDFHALREFQTGDRVKLIHWPTSARSHHLVVRQFDRQLPGRVTLVFHSIRPDQKPQSAEVFEGALELLCGMLHQLHERVIPVDLIASFNQWEGMPADSPEHLDAALRTLATAKRKAERNPHALHEVLAGTKAGDRVIILSDVPLKEWQDELPDLPCMTLCLSLAEMYLQPPRMRAKAPIPEAFI